jgi:nucleoside-diphosphate-sugar epimerase
MIVAVTGANGFIGRHLRERFAVAGCDVRPVVRADYESGRLDERLRGATIVVHAAGATRAPTTVGLQRANVELTERTLAAAQRAGVDRFVFVSSQAAAGPAPFRDSPVREDTPPSPIEAYGRSKLDAEARVTAAALPWTIVRPAAVYGPGDRDFLAMFRLARRGIALHPGNRAHWISIAFVHDIVDGIIAAAMSSGAERRTYFLGCDEPRQWGELFALAAASAERRLRVDADVPVALVSAAAGAADIIARLRGRAGLLTSEKLALSRAKYWVCSSDRARRELGFDARTPLEDGFRRTYVWYREAGWL